MRFLILLVLISCTKPKAPEAFLKSYIYSRYGKVVKKDYVLENSTGEFYNEINEIDGEALTKLLDLKLYSLSKFKILSKECNTGTCTISFSIRYKQAKDTIYSKKIVTLEKEESAWKIARVNNVKTFIESGVIVK
jgi:hypothetical protein